MKRLRDHVFLNVAAEPRLGIQSRVHMHDLPDHIVGSGWRDIEVNCYYENDSILKALLERELKFEHHLVDMPAQHMMSQTFASQLDPRVTYTVERNGRFLQGIPGDLVQKMYEDDTIEQHIPWLDGAREHLMNLAVWAEGG